MNKIIEFAGGNPGALNVLIAAQQQGEAISKPIFEALDRIPTLRGTNIYILQSDLCGGNFETMAHLCKNVPDNILADASNRQDYSGRKLVKDYMPK